MDLSKLPKLSQTPPPPPAGGDAGPYPSGGAPAGPATTGGGPNVELYCRCGAPITPGTNFCSHCGASYQQATGGAPYRRDSGGYEPVGGLWVEALVSIAFGLFLLLMAPGGVKYLSATLAGRPYTPYTHPTEPGQFVDYLRYENTATGAVTDYKYRDLFNAFWNDMVVTVFALALIVDGIVLALVRRPKAVLVAALLIAGATLLNVWYVVASYTRANPITGQSYGLPMLSMLAVIAGIAMAGYQFSVYADSRRR